MTVIPAPRFETVGLPGGSWFTIDAQTGNSSDRVDKNMQGIRIIDGVTAEHSGDRLVVLDPAGSAMSTLNPTGAVIWGVLEADMSLDDLVNATAKVFSSVGRQQLSADVREFVQELVGLDLLSAED